MIRKGKSHDGNVKIKQIMQSEKVEIERDMEREKEGLKTVRIVGKGNETDTERIQGDIEYFHFTQIKIHLPE